jgi:hypothetical protein
MVNNEFFELYRHPKWQEKRLEIMNDANFTCERCGSKEKTLNVHHRYYEKGKKPWQYPNESLDCLCEDCHKDTQNELNDIKALLHKIPPRELWHVVKFLKWFLEDI